jgi:putative hydrolases of HD superfamily
MRQLILTCLSWQENIMTASALAALCEQIIVLKRLPRTGWLQRGIAAPESVADHSFGVALLALAVAGEYPKLDCARLLALAVVHDVGEALLTDLPLTAQRLIGRDAKQAAERRAVEQLLAALPDGGALVELWAEYAAGATSEARLVKALDRIELLAQALAYEQSGQRNLAEFWHGWEAGWEEFPELGALAAELARQR